MSQLYKKIEYGVILIILHSSLAIRSPENNFNPALGIILFIAGTLLVGTLDYKVLVM